jgi:hypothetical protein
MLWVGELASGSGTIGSSGGGDTTPGHIYLKNIVNVLARLLLSCTFCFFI